MAKLETVIAEIVAEAHRLRVLIEQYTEPGQPEYELARSLVHDLENVNLPKLMEKHRKRGATIARYQYKNESRNVHKRRAQARLAAFNSELRDSDPTEFEHYDLGEYGMPSLW